jgi:uncharacterized membrane protein YtjA (UPF0391 family)
MDTSEVALSTVSYSTTVTEALVPLQLSGGFLRWAIVFIVLAIIAAAVGASGVAGISMAVAKWFIIIFVLLAIVSLLL